MKIKRYTEQGITVEITHSIWHHGKIDCTIYFVGENGYYMPTTHDTVRDAESHATRFIDQFVTDGGMQGYQQRIDEHYASLR